MLRYLLAILTFSFFSFASIASGGTLAITGAVENTDSFISSASSMSISGGGINNSITHAEVDVDAYFYKTEGKEEDGNYSSVGNGSYYTQNNGKVFVTSNAYIIAGGGLSGSISGDVTNGIFVFENGEEPAENAAFCDVDPSVKPIELKESDTTAEASTASVTTGSSAAASAAFFAALDSENGGNGVAAAVTYGAFGVGNQSSANGVGGIHYSLSQGQNAFGVLGGRGGNVGDSLSAGALGSAQYNGASNTARQSGLGEALLSGAGQNANAGIDLDGLSPLAQSIISTAKAANPGAFENQANIGNDQTPDQYNLYVDNPDSSGPKVTINALTGVADQFAGSDALFNLFGYSGNARRYGDGAYETRLIREQIMRLTGQRFVGGATSDSAQYQALLGGGQRFASSVGLGIGQTPSASQLSSLTEDIVWLVTKVIDGESYLVPKVYLANSYERPTGAAIGGQSIDFDIDGALNNAGQIFAEDRLYVKANTITNQMGDIQSRGDIALTAQGDIKNLSGIIKGDSVLLDSKEGDIVNETLLQSINKRINGGDLNMTVASRRASIESTNGSVVLKARDINNTGANIRANQGAIVLNAARNVNINALEQNRDFLDDSGKTRRTQNRSTYIRSTLETDQTLQVVAKNDVNLEAVKIKANNTFVSAGNRVNITAVKDSNYDFKSKKKKKWYGSKSLRIDESLHENVIGTDIDTANLSISGKNGVLLESTNINASNTASIVSQNGDVTLTAKDYTNAEYHKVEKSSLFGLLSKESEEQRQRLNYAGANATATNQLTINGKTVSLVGSSIESSNINLTAEQLNLVDLKAKDSYSLNSDDSGVLLRTIHTEGYVKESAVSAHIKTNGSLILNNQDVTDQLSLDGVMDTLTQMTGISDLELQQLQVTLAEDQEWEETTVMLSKMGTLIVQAVVSYLTAGMDGGLVSGLGNKAIDQAVSMAVKSLTKQALSGLLEAAITGNGLNLDLGAMARNALQAGVSVGLNMELASHIDAEGVVGFSLETAGQAGIQSLVYGTNFGDALTSSAIGGATDKAFAYVGHGMYSDMPESIEKDILKTTTHALVGGVAAELNGGDFSSGAIATATSHVVSEYMTSNIGDAIASGKSYDEFKNEILALSELTGGTSALLANPDISDEDLAMVTGLSASVSENNSLSLDAYNVIKDRAEEGDKSALLFLMIAEGADSEEIGNTLMGMTEDEIDFATKTAKFYGEEVLFEKTLVEATEDLAKNPETYKELSGYNDFKETVENTLNGDYSDAMLSGAGLLLHKIPGGSVLYDKIKNALKNTDGKTAEIDGKFYTTDKDGDVAEVSRMEQGKNYENDQVQARKDQFGDDNTAIQVTLVPQNSKGNIKGNSTRADGLTKTGVDNYGNPVYTIDEDKLSNFTRLTKGQNAALKEVVQGSGKFEVRSDVPSLGLYKDDIITVKTYKVNRKESPLNSN